MTSRTYKKYWTETKKIVNGEVRQRICCCAGAGLSPRDCMKASGNKNPCRCDCHRGKVGPAPEWFKYSDPTGTT